MYFLCVFMHDADKLESSHFMFMLTLILLYNSLCLVRFRGCLPLLYMYVLKVSIISKVTISNVYCTFILMIEEVWLVYYYSILTVCMVAV